MAISRFGVGKRMSQAVVHGDTVYLAGQVAETTVGQGVAAQTQEILAKIDALLAQAGSGKDRLLMVNIWLTDMGTFAEMNAVWDAWVVEGQTPGRATVEAKLATPAHSVEIAVVASR